jgi:aminobenzoyl-glutamate transport protein
MTETAAPKTRMQNILDTVERVGNQVPHPVMIFVYLIGIIIVLSTILSVFGARVNYQAYNPATGNIEAAFTEARSLLSIEGIRFMYTGVVGNFMSFTAVGVIIIAMVGVGVAEESGLVKVLIRKLVIVSPRWALSWILCFVGILSSVAADAGYLVLIPLAAAAFMSVGRHPLAGLAIGFASVASAFLVNILIVPVDGILTEITNDAIRLVDPNRSIDLAANLWFSIGSVLLLTVLIVVITERVIEPRLGKYTGDYVVPGENVLSAEEYRGLRFAGYALLAVLGFIALLLLPPGAPLRHPTTGAIIQGSPFMNSLIVTIALIFGVVGAAYGRGAGTMKNSSDIIGAMQKSVSGLGGLILLLLVISQFIAFFNYTNMATLAAVSSAKFLAWLNLPSIALIIGFVVAVMGIDLIITAAIAKWAIFAPVFVPLLMQLGVEPEVVLAAYRVGDSPLNAITPLNAYFAMIVTFAIKYQKDAGVGTVIALMLPYVMWISVLWTAFLAGWYLLGIPWGLG